MVARAEKKHGIVHHNECATASEHICKIFTSEDGVLRSLQDSDEVLAAQLASTHPVQLMESRGEGKGKKEAQVAVLETN